MQKSIVKYNNIMFIQLRKMDYDQNVLKNDFNECL